MLCEWNTPVDSGELIRCAEQRRCGHGDGGMIHSHPFEALAWLANSRAARGLGLRNGAFVFLGSLIEAKWPMRATPSASK
jgi:2-keto-4-pentenoate hydratase